MTYRSNNLPRSWLLALCFLACLVVASPCFAAAPTLETDASTTTLRITDGTSGDPVTFDDVWNWDDGGGSSGGDGDVPVDGGGTVKVNTFLTEIVANAVYTIQKNIDFGDGSTATFFKSLNEMIYFDDGKTFEVKSAATLQTGELSGSGDEEFGINGSRWRVANTSNWNIIGFGSTTAELDIYASTLELAGADHVRISAGVSRFKSSTVLLNMSDGREFFFQSTVDSLFMNRVFLSGGSRVQFNITPDEFLSVHRHNGTIRVVASVTLINLLLTNTNVLQGSNAADRTFTLINPTFSADVQIFNATAKIIHQEPVNLTVHDRDGNALENATVSMTSFGNIVSDDSGTTFYRCIVDHTAGTFATDVSAGKWTLTTAANAALAGVDGTSQNGEWITGIDYGDAETVFSVSTDSGGDIAEQTVTYKQWVGTSEALLSESPHTITVNKAPFANIVKNNITLDAPITATLPEQVISNYPYPRARRR